VPKTLLAVDDSVTMRKVLEITFSSDDFRVLGAENSQKALAHLAEEPIAALIDTSLEGDDGYNLAKQIRARDPRIAIVLMASRYNPYDANRGREAGADDYADKPFDTTGLLDKVKKAIAAREGLKAAPAPAPAPPAAAPGPMAPPFASTPRPAITAAVPSRGPIAVGNRAHTLSFDSGPVVPAPGAAPAPTPTMQQRAAPPAAASRPAAPPAGAPLVTAVGPAPAPKTSPVAVPSPHNVPTAAPPAAAPAPSPAAPAVAALGAVPAVFVNGQLAGKLDGLGLTPQQVEAVLSLSRDLVERVVWEVVPLLAETMIKEEIARLTKEG
jgi:DNA-binding response OmpR family regulator